MREGEEEPQTNDIIFHFVWLSIYLSIVGHSQIVKYLLSKGANPEIKFDNFLTPLHVASRAGD